MFKQGFCTLQAKPSLEGGLVKINWTTLQQGEKLVVELLRTILFRHHLPASTGRAAEFCKLVIIYTLDILSQAPYSNLQKGYTSCRASFSPGYSGTVTWLQ